MSKQSDKITESKLKSLAEQVRERIAQQQLSPLERFSVCNSFQEPDRVPVILQIHEHAARLAGLPVRRICEDPMAHVYCQLTALLEYGHDLPCSFADCYNIEVEALGTELVYKGDRFGEVGQHIISEPSDLDGLSMPDFTKAGRMPWTLEVNGLLKELVGDIMGAYAAVTAPFSIAVNLRGYEQLMLDIVENRAFVHRLMEFCTWLSAGFAQVQLQHGAMATSIIDAWASPPLVSLELFDEFVLPYTARVIGMLAPSGASWGGIWGCANVPQWKDLVYRVIASGSVNVRAFGLDLEKRPEISLSEYKSLLTANRRPMLCCVTAKLLAYGSTSDIENKVKEIMAQAAAGGGFILYGAMVPIETRAENVRAFVEAGKRFGSYPIRV
ncbi:MAG: uroporphyrinogen decarboxylase family protein [Planctomycetota bacterium]|jgi:uroporphyrinogen decarboxylase